MSLEDAFEVHPLEDAVQQRHGTDGIGTQGSLGRAGDTPCILLTLLGFGRSLCFLGFGHTTLLLFLENRFVEAGNSGSSRCGLPPRDTLL
jgi:hypothetical protein